MTGSRVTLASLMLITLGLFVSATAYAGRSGPEQTASGYAHGVGWIQFSKYKAREISKLSELPGGIRTKLQEHLTNRLGERLYRRFTFSAGQVVDWPEFRRVEPNPGYKWKVFTYNLMFDLRAPEVGIARYSAAIELDSKGDVIEMIGFPPARRLPHKAKFVQLSSAYATAARIGFDRSKTRAELVYNNEIESIIFRLTQRYTEGDAGRDHIVDIDAHGGRLISHRWENWQRHY